MTLGDARHLANCTIIIVFSALITLGLTIYGTKLALIDLPAKMLNRDKFDAGECVRFTNTEPWMKNNPIGKIKEVGKNSYLMTWYDYIHAYGGVIDEDSVKGWTDPLMEAKARINATFKAVKCPEED